MKSFTYVIRDEIGVHARPAGLLVKQAKSFQSSCIIHAGVKCADLSRLFQVIGMGIEQGTEVTVTAEGPDENAAISALEKVLKENL
nr:HPr family phosphocarrier protein [uncultured Caproiciproducens sp.]